MKDFLILSILLANTFIGGLALVGINYLYLPNLAEIIANAIVCIFLLVESAIVHDAITWYFSEDDNG